MNNKIKAYGMHVFGIIEQINGEMSIIKVTSIGEEARSYNRERGAMGEVADGIVNSLEGKHVVLKTKDIFQNKNVVITDVKDIIGIIA
jgi:hypothetical protein